MTRNWGFREAWICTLAIKIVIAVLIPLSLDESYYWFWGQHPQLSYFDHPPMVGWLFFLGRAFEFIGGSSSRIPGVLLGHCTLLIWYFILKPYLSDQQRRLWLIFVVASPLIGWGSLIQTPDVSFVFFWSLSILAFIRALETQSIRWYLFLGAGLGLGFCAKYPTVLFVPAVFLYLLLEKKLKQVRWSYVPLTILCGLIFCAPVLLWNYQNGWASFVFQLGHGLQAGPKKSSLWPLKYLAEQLLFIFPVVVIYTLKSKLPSQLRMLPYFAWLPIGFFLFTSFKARVEPNWPIAAYPAFLSIAFFSLQNSPWLKRTVGFWLACFCIILAEIFFPFLPIPPQKLKTNEIRKFDAFLPHAKNLEPLFGNSYQMASAISYKLKRDIPKLQGMNRRDFYDFFPPARPKSDRFFVMLEGDEPLPTWVAEEGYEIRGTTNVTELFRIIELVKRAKASDT